MISEPGLRVLAFMCVFVSMYMYIDTYRHICLDFALEMIELQTESAHTWQIKDLYALVAPC